MMTKRRIWGMVGVVLVAILFTTGVRLWLAWDRFIHTPVVLNEPGITYKLHAGASIKSVVHELYQQKIIRHPSLFSALAYLRGDAHALKKGEYFFPKGTTPSQMLDQMITATGLVQHSFTILPGWNFRQLREALNNDEDLRHLTSAQSDATIMQRLGQSTVSPEGQFYPDTYFFIADTSDLALLRRAMRTMQARLTHAWQYRSPSIPFKTPYEALIAASLVEKEARLDKERPIIAGVLINRLQKNMLLQFDPTVIYGLGLRYDGKIYKHDLTEDTPYNTYVHKGLPPTPIAMPGLQSINAVLHPKEHDYLYFVATGDHVSHQFTRTLAEHYSAVQTAKLYQSDSPSWFFNSNLMKEFLLKFFQKAEPTAISIEYKLTPSRFRSAFPLRLKPIVKTHYVADKKTSKTKVKKVT